MHGQRRAHGGRGRLQTAGGFQRWPAAAGQQGLRREPRQEHRAVPDRPQAAERGHEHPGRAHRFAAPGSQAASAL